MTGQEINLDKKRRGRPAIGRGDQVNTMLRPDLAEGLDAYAAAEPDKPVRSEAIRRILRSWLTERGFIRPTHPDEGKRPDQLDAENDG